MQSNLSLGDFEVENSDGAPGLALIRNKFGDDYVCKVIPSCPRGMADKGIVKVRILCELRFEKGLRSVQSKLVFLSAESDDGLPPVSIGDRTYSVKFQSLQRATELVEAGEGGRGGGGRGTLENLLRGLQAENKKAVAKLAEVLEQIEGLADSQKMAQINNAKKFRRVRWRPLSGPHRLIRKRRLLQLLRTRSSEFGSLLRVRHKLMKIQRH